MTECKYPISKTEQDDKELDCLMGRTASYYLTNL